jgi:hypothetical protein
MREFTNKLSRRLFWLCRQLTLKLTHRFWRTQNSQPKRGVVSRFQAVPALAFLALALFSLLTPRSSAPAQAAAGINQQINFQARLFNAAGAVVPDGDYNIEFKIYCGGNGVPGTTAADCNSATDEQLLWTESRLNNNSQGVTVRNGYFSVQLGSITALSAVDFNDDKLWLSLNVGSTNTTCTPFSSCTPDGEMNPMQRFGSNAYAFNSRQLQGLNKDQFVQLAQGLQADSSTTNASIAINKTGGTANILQLQRGGADVLIINNAGQLTFKPQTDDASAFKVQKADGSVTVLNVDTTNARVGINTAAPTADLSFGAGANRIINVLTQPTANTAGNKLTVQSGTGNGTGAGGDLVLQAGGGGATNASGGNFYAFGGAATGTGTAGNVILAHNGTSAVGNVGVGTIAPTSTLHVVSAAPAADGGASGAAGTNGLTVVAGAGQGTTGTTGQSGGTGGVLSMTAGAGGSAPAGSTNGNGGNVTIQAGAPGSGAGTAGTYGNLLFNTAGGNVGIGDSTPASLLTVGANDAFQVNATGAIAAATGITTSGTITFSGLNCTTFANGGTLTANASGVVSCADDDGGAGGGTSLQAAYTASGTTDPQILLNATNGGIKIRDDSTPVTGNLLQLQNNAGTATYLGISATAFTLQDSSGNNALVFDSTTSELKVYANTTSPTAHARIYYDSVNSEAVFTASTGVTRIGSGSGNITIALTGHTDIVDHSKTYTATAAYSQSEFNIVRNITGGANPLTGNVAKIEDLSTFTSGSSAPNLLYINQNNTAATGNLILAQTGGGANDKFKVSTAGTVTIAAGQSYTGAGAVNVTAGASAALTLTGNAASTWSTSTGNLVLQAGGANTVVLKPGTDSTNAVQIQKAGGTSMLAFDSSANQIKVGVSDTTATLFVLDTKTDTGDPTGVNGGMYYNSNANALRCYENGTWVDCVGGVTKIYSFIDSTSDAAVDANTTDYWDQAAENGNAHPNITLPSTNLKVYGVITMEGQSTGTADVEVTARVERNIGSAPTCGSGTAVGGKPGVFATNTSATKSSTVTFLDDPATTSTVYYTLCSDADTVGTIMNITRIRFTFFMVKA